MAEEPDELKRHMAEQRNRIDQSINELGDQFETATDWKTYVRQHPWWTLGGGFAAGLLLSGLAGSGKTISGGSRVSHEAGMLGQRIDNLFGTALGLAADVVENVVMDAFPILRSRHSKSA